MQNILKLIKIFFRGLEKIFVISQLRFHQYHILS